MIFVTITETITPLKNNYNNNKSKDNNNKSKDNKNKGSRVGAVAIILSPHHCDAGSILGSYVNRDWLISI